MAPFPFKLSPSGVFALVLRLVLLPVATVTLIIYTADRPGAYAGPIGQTESTSLGFRYGQGIQIVDPSGLNRVPFWVGRDGITVEFALYALPAPELVRRYGAEPYPPDGMDVHGLTPALTWQQSYPAGANSSGVPTHVALPPDAAPGLYVIEATHATEGRATALLSLGRSVLMLKRGAGGQFVAWASRLQDGTPVDDMTVFLYDRQGNVLAQQKTGDDGLAEFAVPGARPAMAIGHSAQDVTLAGLDWRWISDGGYWYWDWAYSGAGAPDDYGIYLYTDRPLYRPGQTIYWHGYVRRQQQGRWAPLAGSEVMTATLRDSRQTVIATSPVTADEFGSVDGAFGLAEEPPLGQYTVELDVEGQSRFQPLRVEEYRKPEYGVTVLTPGEYGISGDAIPITVVSDYFFGQPVGGAGVKLEIFRQPYYGGWGSQWQVDSFIPPGGTPLAVLTGVTGADGRWTTSYAADTGADGDAIYVMAATVTDAANRPVQGSKNVIVYWNTFALGVQTPKYGYQTGEPVVATVAARGHDGSALAGKSVTVRFVREVWGDGGSTVTDALPAQQAITDAQGLATVTFSGAGQGWYRIEATATDDRVRQITAQSYLWLYDSAESGWWYSTDNELVITPDRASYMPGERAQLLIQSRVTGVALLALEREGVLWEQVVEIDGPITTVDVPVVDTFAPNVHVRLHMFKPALSTDADQWGEGRLLSASAELTVPATDKRLNVEIDLDAPEYGPGGEAVVSLYATDFTGQPVVARVGLVLVDEALYALQDDLSAGLFDTFYGHRRDQVLTYSSLTDGTRWRFYSDDGSVAPGPPAPLEDAAPGGTTSDPQLTRRAFLDTAYWNPNITTGPDGRATVAVPLPDNLTTWRVLVRAVTAATEAGESTVQLMVTQEMVVRPQLPRFAVVGDRFLIDAVAQNFSDAHATGSLALRADHLVILDPASRGLDVPDRGSATATWTAVAAEAKTSAVTTTLESTQGHDRVELPLPVQAFAVPERWVAAGQAAPVAGEAFVLPENAVPEASRLVLRLSPTLALGLLEGLDDLIDYPYGCVEQTMSRVLPSAAAAKVYADLGLANPKAAELPDILNQGLQKLYGFQQGDGSWGWFYADEGGVFMTAYVLYGLTTVDANGYAVDADVLNRGFAYLDGQLDAVQSPGVRAFALYVKSVAGRGNLGAAQALASQRGVMDASALAALALTLSLEGDHGLAQTVLDDLLAKVEEMPATAFWPRPDATPGWYDWHTMASAEKNTAMAVMALVRLRAEHPLLPKAIRWLMSHRRGAGWRNTQATAFAVLGLADYVRAAGELQSDFRYNVRLNGETLAEGQVTPATVAHPISPLDVGGAVLRNGENHLQVQVDGQGTLYYTALLHQQLFHDEFSPVTSSDQGLKLQRAYRTVKGTPRSDGAYTVGDLVEVQLTLDVREELSYLLIEDPIPAGFEVVNERMPPTIYGDVMYADAALGAPWREWGYDRKDVHDDRVDFFVTYAWPGQHHYTYLMRATSAGEFSVLPGQAYPMYADEIWGRSASHQVRVEPERLANRPFLAGDIDHSCQVTGFDVRQVAGAWFGSEAGRNVAGDSAIDLYDVAAVAGRLDASCLADRALPGDGSGQADFALVASKPAIRVGERMAVSVAASPAAAGAALAGNGALGGFGMSLAYDPALLQIVEVRWSAELANELKLGPVLDDSAGRVAFGAYSAGGGGLDSLVAGEDLITVVFAGRGVGEAAMVVEQVQAVDELGRRIAAQADFAHVVTVDTAMTFFPVVGR